MFKVGLNPYGIAYSVGLYGRGTPRANPDPIGLAGFLRIANEIASREIEFADVMLAPLDAPQLDALAEQLAERHIEPIIATALRSPHIDDTLPLADRLGVRTVRLGLSKVLEGARGAMGDDWPDLVERIRRELGEFAAKTADHDLRVACENHQDFGSEELMQFATDAGEHVGVCLDTGNPLAVGEEPLAFTRTIAPRCYHVHLKDYRAHWSDDGFRLVRCAIGDGAIPLHEMNDIISEHRDVTASLEPGALDARHIRLLTPQWWQGYPQRSAVELAACLRAARQHRLPSDADWRTPWERDAPPNEIVAYEMQQLDRSVHHMRQWGWL